MFMPTNALHMTMAIYFALLAASVAIPSENSPSELPPAVERDVDFHREVLPILAKRCALCHTQGRTEGEFSVATRDTLLRGGASGPAIVLGRSAESMLVELVAGVDDSRVMPAKGPR
jgi:hypothetical protein